MTILSTNWEKGGPNILKDKRRVGTRKSMVGNGREDEGKRTTKIAPVKYPTIKKIT